MRRYIVLFKIKIKVKAGNSRATAYKRIKLIRHR